MLKKRGNSNTKERIDLVNRFIALFGKQCIDSLVADREFVGDKWIAYLNHNNIGYHIRIRNNFKIFLPRKNKTIKAYWLFNNLKIGQHKHYEHIINLHGQLCYISGARLKKGEFLLIISFNNPAQAKKNYKQRWQIEMCFKAMKSSGFDIEKTHLNKIDWRDKINMNYYYPNTGILTSSYAGKLYGNFYIQNDYDYLQFNEKFFLSEDKETKTTDLKIVCGPFGNDFDAQKSILINWAQKVKELSEKITRINKK